MWEFINTKCSNLSSIHLRSVHRLFSYNWNKWIKSKTSKRNILISLLITNNSFRSQNFHVNLRSQWSFFLGFFNLPFILLLSLLRKSFIIHFSNHIPYALKPREWVSWNRNTLVFLPTKHQPLHHTVSRNPYLPFPPTCQSSSTCTHWPQHR